jgi:MFS family permease
MYRWIVFLHIVGLVGFLLSHGASVSMAFALRRERKLERIHALLDLSGSSFGAMSGSLLLLLISGIIAGFMGNWWSYGWIWLSLGLLIALWLVMGIFGSRHYTEIRKATGFEYMEYGKRRPAGEPASPEEMEALLSRPRPVLLAVTGIGGVVVILWLMMFKPF